LPLRGLNMDESIRALERAAREGGGAADWTALAAALAREGRASDAYSAAVRATALDPASPARGFLTASWIKDRLELGIAHYTETVPWTGLRELAKPRVLQAGALSESGFPAGVRDLGGGVVAFPEEGQKLTAVDLVTGEVRWRRPWFHLAAVAGGRGVG